MSDVPSRTRLRCRRGTKEMDLLLERFLAHGYGALDEGQRAQFEALLDLPDQDLYDWIAGRTPPRPEFADLTARIRATSSLLVTA